MPDDEPAVQAALAGLDAPRPLPPALAEELDSLVLRSTTASTTSTSQLRGVDGPRAVPSAVAKAVVTTILAAVAQRDVIVRRRDRHVRWLGAAAGVLIIAGVLAATTRAVPGADDLAVRPTSPPFAPWFPANPPPTTSTTVPPPEPPPSPVVALAESDPAYARLETFADCDQLLRWVKPRAEWVTDEFGLATWYGVGSNRWPAAGAPTREANTPQPVPSAAAAGHSGTNVQEVGVDEPDMLKVTGSSLLLLTYQALQIVDTRGGGAALASTTPVGTSDTYPRSLLLHESTAVVLSEQGGAGNRATQLRFLDVADPAAPVDSGSIAVAGALVDARVVDGVAHVVTGWSPGPFTFVHPSDPNDQAEVERAAEENRRVVRESTVEQWIPPGVPCDRVAYPRDLAGFSTVLIWSVPIADPSAAMVRGLLADPGTVYASTDRLVIATERWDYGTLDAASPSIPPTVRTNIHRFALESGDSRYLSSGSVPGFLRSSYALSEYEGYLRVASTDRPPGAPGATTSTVTVLGDDGYGLLTPVGSIGGLGAGQTVQGVRFVREVGYVVTFRQTDPLYTIDLSDPSHPRLRGALEVTGFSGYLHPLGDGRLLGIGVEADGSGAATGGAVSLYDVSNLDDPRLAQRIVEPSVDFSATVDPHAFLLWEPTGQVVLPAVKSSYVTREDGTSAYEVAHSFEVFRLDAGGAVRQGTIDHGGHGEFSDQGIAYRAAMVDGVLYTVSSAGVLASDAQTLDERGWAALPVIAG